MVDLASQVTIAPATCLRVNPGTRSQLIVGLFLLLATTLVRWPAFGDPNYHIDEGFYLLVGERMHQGLLPYVDIWDRKPVGLFIVYWLVTAFGDVYAYQLAAGLSVWVTAWIVFRISQKLHGGRAAFAAAILYIVSLEVLAGGGGQSPIFYNSLMAGAGWATLCSLEKSSTTQVQRLGFVAMLLCGLAMTVKQTSLFEGVFFGLALVGRTWQLSGLSRSLQLGLIFILIALTPTAISFGFFAAVGHFDTYYDATISSIFLTAPAHLADETDRIIWLVSRTIPLALVTIAAALYVQLDREPKTKLQRIFLLGWVFFALLGFFAVPNYYDHYALPVMVSISVLASRLFKIRILGLVLGIFLIFWFLSISGYPRTKETEASIRSVNQASTLIQRHRGKDCIFVFDAPANLYRETGSCLPSTRVFSEHLSNAREAKAVGIDPAKETRRILERSPSVVVIAAKPTLNTPNLETLAIVRTALTSDYHLVDRVTLHDVVGSKPIEIWVRR